MPLLAFKNASEGSLVLTAADGTTTALKFGIMALGMTVVIITGGIDLSVGSIMGLVAIVAGVFYIVLPKGDVSTDAAYLEADVSTVSPRIRGLVAEVLVKHNEPAGVARGATPVEAFERAFEADALSEEQRATLDALFPHVSGMMGMAGMMPLQGMMPAQELPGTATPAP